METLKTFKSFNDNKSIDELQYNILRHEISLKNLNYELLFFKSLLGKSIFKPHAINLFETITKFKNEINTLNEHRNNLLNDLSNFNNLIRKKIECDDLACDRFFIKEYDDIDLEVYNYNDKISNLKFRLIQYVESVINN